MSVDVNSLPCQCGKEAVYRDIQPDMHYIYCEEHYIQYLDSKVNKD